MDRRVHMHGLQYEKKNAQVGASDLQFSVRVRQPGTLFSGRRHQHRLQSGICHSESECRFYREQIPTSGFPCEILHHWHIAARNSIPAIEWVLFNKDIFPRLLSLTLPRLERVKCGNRSLWISIKNVLAM